METIDATASDCRALWLGVVSQSLDDLTSEPYDSLDFQDSHSLFHAAGEWSEHLALIAEAIDRHPDDLRRMARRQLAARLIREPMPARPTPPEPPAARPQQAIIALPPPPKPTRQAPKLAAVSRAAWLQAFINSGYRTATGAR